jgi:hypothetical protein
MSPSLLLPLLLAATALAQAAPASFSAGKGQLLCGTSGEQVATWGGACTDGLADGSGVATWTDDTTPNKFEGTLARGQVSGSATLVYGNTTYIGTFRTFEAHGQGFFKYPDGSMYEGGVDMGNYSGPGIFQDADRSRYEGEWVNGRREGQGRAIWTVGGSYDGHWRHGQFDGQGTIVYIGGRTYTGQFKDGRVAGLPPLAPVEQRTFHIANTETHVRSLIPGETSTSPVSGSRWNDLSENEKRIVKLRYPALEDGDEPPYPLEGMRPLSAGLTKVGYVDSSFEGILRMNVLVGADGKAKSATAVGKLPPEVAKYIGGVLLITRYKPAICHGTPCDMLFPFVTNFEHRL